MNKTIQRAILSTIVSLFIYGSLNYSSPAIACEDRVHLTVYTTPPNAKVRILNIIPRYQDGIELESGNYDIEVSQKGYKTYRKQHQLENGEQTITIDLYKEKIVKKTEKKKAKKTLHGSIAFSQDSNGGWTYGFAWNSNNRNAVKISAMNLCIKEGGEGCREIQYFRNTCAALAIGDNNGYGTAGGKTLAEAERKAVNSCRKANKKCKFEVARCIDGTEKKADKKERVVEEKKGPMYGAYTSNGGRFSTQYGIGWSYDKEEAGKIAEQKCSAKNNGSCGYWSTFTFNTEEKRGVFEYYNTGNEVIPKCIIVYKKPGATVSLETTYAFGISASSAKETMNSSCSSQCTQLALECAPE